jgi:glycosyltransferase involved in cell wall biosynthesis
MSRPRIAFLLPGVGAVDRGAETFVLEVARRLQDEFEVTILCRGGANALCRRIRAIARDATILTWSYDRSAIERKVRDRFFLDPANAESLSFTLCAFSHLWRDRYDLLLPINGVWGAMACGLLRRAHGTPFITVGQAGIGRPDLWQARQKPDIHVVLTEYARRWIAGLCPNLTVRVIPNGVDVTRFRPDLVPVPLPLERPLYLCVAAAESYKNIHLTIEAVSHLPRGSLVVLGTGPLRSELEAQGMRQLGPERFMGQAAPHADMPSYYAACDVFTLVSEAECEGFGVAYVEAMACNKPIVATDDAMRAEIIGDAGILCNGHDVQAYATALEEAASPGFGDKPRKRAEQLFSWDMIALQYRQLITDCLSSKS